MKRFIDLVNSCLPQAAEIFSWDLCERLDQSSDLILLDLREPYEFAAMRMPNYINVPRGILDVASELDYEETVPEIVTARERKIVVICLSGFRSVLSAFNMQQMGCSNVCSLKTELRGWNDFEKPRINSERHAVGTDDADEYFRPGLRPEQMKP